MTMSIYHQFSFGEFNNTSLNRSRTKFSLRQHKTVQFFAHLLLSLKHKPYLDNYSLEQNVKVLYKSIGVIYSKKLLSTAKLKYYAICIYFHLSSKVTNTKELVFATKLFSLKLKRVQGYGFK